MTNKYHKIINKLPAFLLICSTIVLPVFISCRSISPQKKDNADISQSSEQRKYELVHLKSEQCRAFLATLDIQDIRYVPNMNIIFLSASKDQLKKADAIVDVVDSSEEYCIENLGDASVRNTLPSNGQIAARLGNIEIGTFNEPPVKNTKLRAIIDINKDSILAYIPISYRENLAKMLSNYNVRIDSQKAVLAQSASEVNERDEASSQTPSSETESQSKNDFPMSQTFEKEENVKSLQDFVNNLHSTAIVALSEMADPNDIDVNASEIQPQKKIYDELPKTVSISFKPARNDSGRNPEKILTGKAEPANGEDLLELTLPETLTLVQLLDLAGKHLGLNYVYDNNLISNQPITLKLNGNLEGRIKVKNLYALLETVLDFMGLAMIRQDDNLVAIVPIDRALQNQPELVDSINDVVKVGDTIVTRVFNIKYVDISDVITLLQNMKLSISATTLEDNNLLLVTCHAGRMNRVEQLVNMIDQPGRTMECQFRRLYHTIAPSLVKKIRTMAEKLNGITIATASPSTSLPTPPVPALTPPVTPAAKEKIKSVFIDLDERTNRILMIGYKEDLSLIEEIIDVLDVAQADPRTAGIYNIKYISASQALEKLQKLDIIKTTGKGPSESPTGSDIKDNVEEILVIVLEATNQLLVRAVPDQHDRIREFLNYIDVTPRSEKTLFAYELKNIKAEAAKNILEGLDLTGKGSVAQVQISESNEPPTPNDASPIMKSEDSLEAKPQVVINESTNALLISATNEQHKQIARIINYIDNKAPAEEPVYQIYPLENSSPDHIANLLNHLINETTRDKDDKIVEEPKKKEEITIVPDANTFSLIVHASRKNQEWIKELTDRLDKRRPQVLIDVTLVEITRTNAFETDLDVISNAQDSVVNNMVINPIQAVTGRSIVEGGYNQLDSDGNPTGKTRVFYSDNKIQALLTVIEQKNYGRVLAKPKILVDDGQEGEIVTTDVTSYVKETVQIPQTGTPVTTRDFVPIQASIDLLITPHISEGDLLRLSVELSRDDFGSRPLSGAPPDITSSKVNTTVFVPDTSTVILGGLVRLNQNKGHSKVPILGDLPIIGFLFRSIGNNDVEKKLYVFLKANIIRPYAQNELKDLQEISDKYRDSFEKSESQFQNLEDIPGIKSPPMPPEHVLRGYE